MKQIERNGGWSYNQLATIVKKAAAVGDWNAVESAAYGLKILSRGYYDENWHGVIHADDPELWWYEENEEPIGGW